MKKVILFILLSNSTLFAGIPVHENYLGPTEQLIERESWKKIQKKLDKMNISRDLTPYCNLIADLEDWGHVGYHGAQQGYRVYQDIIRMTFEEILGIPIRENFQFLRIPGDSDLNLNSMEEFADFWGTIDNKNDTRRKQLISLNFAIYSNYDQKGSCSLNLFVKNESKKIINYTKQLVPFYKKLGIPPESLKDLFAIAQKWLNEDSGVLLRISEHSHLNNSENEAYNFADLLCYPSKRGGHPWGSYPISNHYERVMTDQYLNHKLDIAPQLRLLVNNQYTQNPLSDLNVERWDLYDPETIAFYEAEMRECIRNLDYDSVKVKERRDYFLELWTGADLEEVKIEAF